MTTLFFRCCATLNSNSDLGCNLKLPTIIERGRYPSPAPAPQALAWQGDKLWMGSRDLRRIYVIDPKKWEVLHEKEPPGIPWAAVATNGTLRFTIGEGPNDDRYIRRFAPEVGFSEVDKIARKHTRGRFAICHICPGDGAAPARVNCVDGWTGSKFVIGSPLRYANRTSFNIDGPRMAVSFTCADHVCRVNSRPALGSVFPDTTSCGFVS